MGEFKQTKLIYLNDLSSKNIVDKSQYIISKNLDHLQQLFIKLSLKKNGKYHVHFAINEHIITNKEPILLHLKQSKLE